MLLNKGLSASEKYVMALPDLPALPVRPLINITYICIYVHLQKNNKTGKWKKKELAPTNNLILPIL